MSHEVRNNYPPYSYKVDIYSLGITIFEIMLGRKIQFGESLSLRSDEYNLTAPKQISETEFSKRVISNMIRQHHVDRMNIDQLLQEVEEIEKSELFTGMQAKNKDNKIAQQIVDQQLKKNIVSIYDKTKLSTNLFSDGMIPILSQYANINWLYLYLSKKEKNKFLAKLLKQQCQHIIQLNSIEQGIIIDLKITGILDSKVEDTLQMNNLKVTRQTVKRIWEKWQKNLKLLPSLLKKEDEKIRRRIGSVFNKSCYRQYY